MLDHEDLKWIATTSTELNSMLQQISRYSDLARQHKGDAKYIEMLSERVELASKTAQALFDRVTSQILEGSVRQAAAAAKAAAHAPFSVVQAPAAPPPAPKVVETPAPPEKPLPAPARSIGPATDKIPDDIRVLNPNGTRELILLVDDEAEISELASDMLTDEGYKVILAKDGFEALRIYQAVGKKVGLVILDFFLPIMDGDAVFDELRALNPRINVVLSSGFAEQSKLGAMLAQGLRGFIPKPYTRAKLLEQVRSILDNA
jgi:CheY-like chemotaxis protein